MSSFFLKQGDTSPALAYTCLDENNDPIPLTGATVTFYMQDLSGVEKITAGAVDIVSAAAGTVSYQWQNGDSDISGIFLAEFVITFAGGTQRTSPDPGWLAIVVSSSLRGD